MLVVISITISFIIVAYAGYALIEATMLRKARIRKRIDGLAETAVEQVTGEGTAQAAQVDRFPTIAKMIASREIADKLLLMLMQAGVKLRPSEFVGIAFGIAMLLALLMAVFTKNILAEVLGIVIGFVIPFIYVKGLQAQRLTAFSRQIPDALSLISSAIRSGFSFQRAMMMVSEEMPNPISEEFQRVINETNVGLATDAALTRMAARVPSYDLQLVVTAVIIQQQIGGNLAEIIDNIAETIRERIKVEGEMAALTAEGKISGVVLVALPIVLGVLISIINPGYMKPLFNDSLGGLIVAVAICLQIFGAIIIKRMLILDY